MCKNYICCGDSLFTDFGYIKVNSYGGYYVYCDEYYLDDDGDCFTIINDMPYTMYEIALLLKRYDGAEHCVEWDYER